MRFTFLKMAGIVPVLVLCVAVCSCSPVDLTHSENNGVAQPLSKMVGIGADAVSVDRDHHGNSDVRIEEAEEPHHTGTGSHLLDKILSDARHGHTLDTPLCMSQVQTALAAGEVTRDQVMDFLQKLQEITGQKVETSQSCCWFG